MRDFIPFKIGWPSDFDLTAVLLMHVMQTRIGASIQDYCKDSQYYYPCDYKCPIINITGVDIQYYCHVRASLMIHISHLLYFLHRPGWEFIFIICPFRATRELWL